MDTKSETWQMETKFRKVSTDENLEWNRAISSSIEDVEKVEKQKRNWNN